MKLPTLWHAMSLLLTAGAVTACVGAPAAEGTDSSDLLGALPDTSNTWSVGVCAGPLNQDPAAGPIGACLVGGTRCTGSLIAPDLVLTARHCVHKLDRSHATGFCDAVFTTTPLTSDPPRVTANPSVLDASPQWFDVAEVLTSPVTSASCAGDLVLLRLATSVPASVARPAFVDLSLLDRHLPNEVAVVGRGAIATVYDTTTYAVVNNDPGGLLRRKLEHIPLVCIAHGSTLCTSPDIGTPFTVDPFYVQIGSSTSLGDSGSGFLREPEFSHGIPRVFAVSSAVTADPVTGIPNAAYGVRLDRHGRFLLDALGL